MLDCPNCGKANSQVDGSFCTYCGANLKNTVLAASNAPSKASRDLDEPYDMQRLEKATKRVERLGYIVAAELVGLLIVIVLLMFTFNLI